MTICLRNKGTMELSSPLEVVSIYMPFAQRMASELNVVCIDHSYAKPWSTHPEASNAQPVRLLFMEPLPRQSSTEKTKDESEIVDVEMQDKPVMPDYDIANARSMMYECERHAALLQPEFLDMKEDWEEHIAAIRTTWTVLQNRLFAKVMRVLQADRLARLTIQETKNEPIQRRLQIDKAAKRVKFAFANVNWEMPLILWLHNLFLENLRGQLLTSYLEILQTLKLKIPSLIDCLIEGTVCKPGGLTLESLNVLLKRTWDPVLSSINQQKPKKLPGQSVLLVISNVPSMANSHWATKRHKFWQHQLGFMGKVVNIVPVNNSTTISIANCVENMVASTRSKILEVKGHYPGRYLVLVGFHIGALVACQVALMEHIQAVVCLGYPTLGVHGNRGEIEDPLYNCKTPTLFVVGQHASSCSVDALEDIREKLRVDTGLIVVGGADDHLRMSRAKKKSCGVTQSVVDRCIIDEVSNFLGNTLQSEVNSSDSMDDVDTEKKTPRKRKYPALAVAVGSQTGNLVKQKSTKALKNSKQDPMLSSVSSVVDGKLLATLTPKQTIPKLKTGKRASPKKLQKSADSQIAMKRQLMQVNLKSGSSKKSQGQSSLSSRSEAAAIASAPELSNLLQNMKPDLSRLPNPQSGTSTSPSVTLIPSVPSSTCLSSSTSLPSSTAPSTIQTTTALTLSKFLLSSNVFKPEEVLKSDTSIDPELDSSVNKSTVTNTPPTSKDIETLPKKQETQILIHTRDSSAPISFPVTFTMASKVLKTSNDPLIKTSSLGYSVPSFDQNCKVIQTQAGQSSSSILSSTLQSVISSSNTSSLMSTTKSPLASVINIGSDTVQMKETPPSTTAPGTVSIDLGQLSTSNNIVMKYGNPTKISLMPTLKPVSSSSLLSSVKSDNALSISGPLGQAKTTVLTTSGTLVKTAVKTQPTTLPVYTSGKPNEKNLTILSSSDLLSSLTSNTGLITLKLSSSNASGITLTPQKLSEKTNAGESKLKVLPVPDKSLAVPTTNKNILSVTYSPSTATITTILAKPVLSQHLQRAQSNKDETTERQVIPTSSMSVIFAPKSDIKSVPQQCSSSSHFTFQTLSPPIESSLRKTIFASSPETLGKVSSLLESSPVTVTEPKITSTCSEFNPSKYISSPDAASKTGRPIVHSPLSQSPSSTPRASKSTVSSYTPTTKNVLPTVASTRTRRIKTPKQYDL